VNRVRSHVKHPEAHRQGLPIRSGTKPPPHVRPNRSARPSVHSTSGGSAIGPYSPGARQGPGSTRWIALASMERTSVKIHSPMTRSTIAVAKRPAHVPELPRGRATPTTVASPCRCPKQRAQPVTCPFVHGKWPGMIR
jgi:hypothetical protein